MTRVLVLATGGTIASTDSAAGARPTRSGESLLGGVPVDRHAEVTVEQITQRPSAEMTPSAVLELARRVRAVDDDVAGVVVTHGTDTMEETAYGLDLLLEGSVPVVLTGAQRLPDELSADGPANLLGAVRAVTTDRLRAAGGVYLLLNDELHAARDATKTHTSRLDTFASPGAGPVAELTPRGFRFLRSAGSRSVHVPADEVTARVGLVMGGIGVGGAAVERAVAGGVDGLVVEAFGLGNTTPGIAAAVESALDDGVTVAVTSRCAEGVVAAQYGSASGGKTLREAGVLFAGALPAHKARIKLLLAESHADDREAVGRLVEAAPGEPTDR